LLGHYVPLADTFVMRSSSTVSERVTMVWFPARFEDRRSGVLLGVLNQKCEKIRVSPPSASAYHEVE
jgi:hypothetical protein